MLRRQAGFTLLELVIAITLMGLVLVMVYGGLHLGMSAWERSEQHSEGIDNIRLVQDFIRSQLRQSVSVFRRDERLGQAMAFEGQTEHIGLVAPLLTHLGRGGLYYIQWDVVEGSDGSGNRLLMHWSPYRPSAEPDAAEEEHIVLEGVSDVEWSYFGLAPGGQTSEWLANWQDPGRRPSLVRLKLNLKGQTWPDLVVALSN